MVPLFYSLCFVSFFVLGFLLARPLRPENNFWKLLGVSLPLSVTAMLVLVGLAGRMLQSFPLGMIVGSALCVLLIVFLILRNTSQPLNFRIPLQLRDVPTILFIIGSTLGVSLLALRYAFHDERAVQGHPALVESMLGGVYPPYFLAFPEIPNKYHYGFDFFSAILSKALDLPGYQGVDAAAIFLWPALLIFAALWLRELGIPRKYLWLALAYVFFSGGMTWLIARHEPGRWQIPQWQFLWIGDRLISHNFVFYFFQHPISLGSFLFLGCLRLFRLWFESGRKYPLLLGSLCLGALSLAHFMFFTTLLASLGFVIFVRFFLKDTPKFENLLSGAGIFLLSVALAVALGGFFQFSLHNYDNLSFRIAWPPGYLSTVYPDIRVPIAWGKALLWYVGSFGLFLGLLPVAVYLAAKQKAQILWLLAGYAVLSFLIPQFIAYSKSGSAEKWFLGFELAGKILCAAVFLPLIDGKKIWAAAAYIYVLFSMVIPVWFIYGLTLQNPRTWRSEERRMAGVVLGRPQGAFQKLVEKLKGCPDCRGTIWGTPGLSRSLAIFTGYPVLQMDNTVWMPVSSEKINERAADIKEIFSAPSLELLERLRIQWVIFSCAEVKALSEPVRTFLEELKNSPQSQDHSILGSGNECYWALRWRGGN